MQTAFVGELGQPFPPLQPTIKPSSQTALPASVACRLRPSRHPTETLPWGLPAGSQVQKESHRRGTLAWEGVSTAATEPGAEARGSLQR